MPLDQKNASAIKSAVAAERRAIAKHLRGIAASTESWLSTDARRALRDAAKEIVSRP